MEAGRRSKRQGICVCIWLFHLAVQQKLTQHCKAIILQLKKKERKKERKKRGERARKLKISSSWGSPKCKTSWGSWEKPTTRKRDSLKQKEEQPATHVPLLRDREMQTHSMPTFLSFLLERKLSITERWTRVSVRRNWRPRPLRKQGRVPRCFMSVKFSKHVIVLHNSAFQPPSHRGTQRKY